MSKNLQSTIYNLEISPEQSQRAYLNILEDMQDEKKAIQDQRIAIFNVLEDISDAKEKVEHEKARIDAAVQNLTDGLASFDEHGKAISVNPRMTALTGLPAEGFYLEEFAKLLKGVDVNAKIKSAIETRQNIHIDEVTLIGRFVYEVFFTPVIDPQDKIIGSLILLHDITHIKEIDRMKTEFVSVASHQLRTPLTSINWYVEMLQSGDAGKLNNEQQGFLNEIYTSSVRMVKLVNDLLNVSRIETGRLKVEPKPLYLDEFIESIIHELEVMAKDYACTMTFKKSEKRLPKIAIDETLMRQVIHNLINNAIRYSLAGACSVHVALEQKNHDYVVSVADQGIGIPKEAQGRIFEKFFRADNAREQEAEGSGIGLYIAKMIVEASGGKLWFESTMGKGTTFYLSIPREGMRAHAGERGLAF